MAMLDLSAIAAKEDPRKADKKMICPPLHREWCVVVYAYSRWVAMSVCLVDPNSPYAEYFSGKLVMIPNSAIDKAWGLEEITLIKGYEATNAFSKQRDGGKKIFAAFKTFEAQARALADRLCLVYDDPLEGMDHEEIDNVDLTSEELSE